jgi:hypothetical protein
MLPLLCAITVVISRQDQSKLINDTVAKEATVRGLVIEPSRPGIPATDSSVPGKWRLLLDQRYAADPWKVEVKLVLIPDAKVRKDYLHSQYQVSSAVQVPFHQAALEGSGLSMFAYGNSPSKAMTMSDLPIGIYGVSGHCIAAVHVFSRDRFSTVSKFDAKKLVATMTAVAAVLGKEAAKVPDGELEEPSEN